MGIGALRRHRDYESTDQEAEAEEEGLQEPVRAHTKDELVEWLESQGYTLEDLEPGTGSTGNVVKADVVAAVEAVRSGEEPEPRGEAEASGGDEEGGGEDAGDETGEEDEGDGEDEEPEEPAGDQEAEAEEEGAAEEEAEEASGDEEG